MRRNRSLTIWSVLLLLGILLHGKAEKDVEESLVQIFTEEELEIFLADEVESDEFALVAHVKKKSARAKMVFKCIKDSLKEWDKATIKFVVVWLAKGADPKSDAQLYMHRPGIPAPDPERIDYVGSIWSEEKIAWWAKNATYPTLGQKFSRNNYAPMSMDEMGWSAAVVGIVDDSTEIEGREAREEPLRPQLEEALLPFAAEYPDWRFVTAEIEKLEDHEFELLGTKWGDDPRIVVMAHRKRYHLVGEDAILDHEEIRKFLDDIKAERRKPTYKSEHPPDEKYDEDGSLIVTGNTFEEIVLNEKKDVFVKFYAPWCQHCQKLAPEWSKLAKAAQKMRWEDHGVLIAHMNVGANECEEEVPSYPRMVLYPAVIRKQKLVKKQVYSGERQVGAFVDFVMETARNLQEEKEEDEEEELEATKKKRRKKRRKGVAEEL